MRKSVAAGVTDGGRRTRDKRWNSSPDKEERAGANTRLAQGYHDSYFLKECHAIR